MSCPVIELAQQLIRRPSLSPDDAGCQALMIERLRAIGFTVEPMDFGDTQNFWAWRGNRVVRALLEIVVARSRALRVVDVDVVVAGRNGILEVHAVLAPVPTPSSPPTYPAIRLTFTTHLPTLNPPASKIIPSLSEPSIPHSSPVRRFSLKTGEP